MAGRVLDVCGRRAVRQHSALPPGGPLVLRGWLWIKGHSLALMAALSAVLLSIVYWQNQRKKIGSLKDAVAVQKARVAITEAQTRKEIFKAQADNTRVQEGELDRIILAKKKEAVEVRQEVDGLSDDEVEAEFARLFDSRL